MLKENAINTLLAGGAEVHGDFQKHAENALQEGAFQLVGSTWWCLGHEQVVDLLKSNALDAAGTYAYFSGVSEGPLVDIQKLWLETSERGLHAGRRAQARKPFADGALMRKLLADADDAIATTLKAIGSEFVGDFNAIISRKIARKILVEWAGIPADLQQDFDDMIAAMGETVGQPLSNDDPLILRTNALIESVFPRLISAQRGAKPGGLLHALSDVRNDDGAMPVEEVAANVVNFAFDSELLEPQLTLAVAELLLRNVPLPVPDQKDTDLLVWELARLGTASPLLLRRTAEPMTIAGRQLEPGTWIAFHLAAALRDPAAFVNPDDIELSRGPTSLVFGVGHHTCLGARLAHQVMRKALVHITGQYEIRLAGPIEWIAGPYRGIKKLPVEMWKRT